VTNRNPSLSGEENMFLPEFYALSTNGAVGSSTWYSRAFDWCQSSLHSLKTDSVAVIKESYPRSVKKNDTDIKLGSVSFQTVSSREVFTNEVFPLLLLILQVAFQHVTY